MDKASIAELLKALGFKLVAGVSGIWSKIYVNHDNYLITVNLNPPNLTDCKILYGSKIIIGRNTTTNFSQKENLVVLECVNHLLEKGYKPESIELEKRWRVGGYLDILVKDDQGHSYLMIDCKQWGTEYNSALKIISQNETRKEQLFNYYLQEKSTKYVALYSSHLSSNLKAEYQNDIIPTEQFRDCDNQKEVYDKWDKVFQSKGIFEANITPYNIKFSSITKIELKAIDPSTVEGKENTDGTIYNRFAEILRRHTVSDKTNAYNKIFNLFLCKIVDEDSKIDSDEMDFQWKESDNAEIVLSRLTDLYKKGMKEYLELDVQFFTPIPITSFVCKSIPFEDIIAKKIEDRQPDFLPYIIDFACGSGHFLTESMERVDKLLQSIQEENLRTKPQKDSLVGWKVSFKWAKKFVYGIDNDYRLTKTTKVACFLNGDGEANIIYGNGLDNFSSPLYRDKLKLTENQKDNPVFDVLIANPPYAVENFKFVLKNGEESFDLFNHISDKSDNIECLFVERAKQLLKVGGYAGIVLPNGLLLNNGIHERTREIILRHFEIFAICDFRSKTFAASGHNTSILFMKRRDDSHCKDVQRITQKFLEDLTDCSFNSIENIFSIYVSYVYPKITFEQYLEKIRRGKADDATNIEKDFLNIEKEKLLYFLLIYRQRCIITKSGEGKTEEKCFLGYEHSDMKKYEGIHPYPDTDNNKVNSMLYSDD